MSRSGVARLDPGGGSRGKSGSGDSERRSLRWASSEPVGGGRRTGDGDNRKCSRERLPLPIGVGVELQP